MGRANQGRDGQQLDIKAGCLIDRAIMCCCPFLLQLRCVTALTPSTYESRVPRDYIKKWPCSLLLWVFPAVLLAYLLRDTFSFLFLLLKDGGRKINLRCVSTTTDLSKDQIENSFIFPGLRHPPPSPKHGRTTGAASRRSIALTFNRPISRAVQ